MTCRKRIWKTGARAAIIAIVFSVFAFRAPEWTKGINSDFVVYGQTGGSFSPPPTTATTVTKVIPQIAAGSFDRNVTKYKSVIQVVNEGRTAATVSANFYNVDGTPSTLVLKTNLRTLPTVTGSFASVSLPANGILVITADTADSFTVNWARIVSTGGTVSASAYFDLTDGTNTQLYSRVGVPASESGMSKFTIPRVRNVDAGLDVGFALVNTGTASATIDATLTSATGSALARKSLTLAAGAHTAAFAKDFFTLTGEATGTNYSFMAFESASAQFAATALAIEGGSLSSFPVSQAGSSGAATGELSDGSVTTAKLARAAVIADKLATDAVTTDKIADSAITGAKVASGQVVKSINSLKDDVTLTAGSNITITPSGNTLSIAASGGLTLPYAGVLTSASPVFSAEQTGAGQVASFIANNPSSASPALVVRTSGTGQAGFFLASNTSNNSDAVYANTAGTGNAGHFISSNVSNSADVIFAETLGKGHAGSFLSSNGSNASDALSVETKGTGSAGFFATTNASNQRPALAVRTVGTGSAGSFLATNASNGSDALYVESQGTGQAGFFGISNASNTHAALSAETQGTGNAGSFVASNASNASDALSVFTKGTGSAGRFFVDNASSTKPALDVVNTGKRWAGFFANYNSSNDYPALAGVHFGIGTAGLFVNFSSSGDALRATAQAGGTGRAGVFEGNVSISGSLTKGSGSFQIDHPLDPANKYLYHSFVESPDMMNVYNGNVTLDENGESWVELPNWLQALNREFRYQLTAIGAPGPNLYVAEEISGNRFKIAGGPPAGRVSWQVTGIRQDPYAEANRIKVEVQKPSNERGFYLHPDAYGQPREKGIQFLQSPELKEAAKHTNP